MKLSTNTLNEALRACRRGIGVVLVFSLAINLLMLTAPLFMLQVFDRVLASRSTDTLLYLFLVALFALAALGALDASRAGIMTRIGVWLDARLSGALLQSEITARLQRKGSGVQSLRDLTTFRQFLCGPGMFAIADAPWTPIFLGVIFILHPLLGSLSLAGALVLLALGLANDRLTRSVLGEANSAHLEALAFAEAGARNADVIEAMGMGQGLVGAWAGKQEKVLSKQALASGRSAAIVATSKFLRLGLQIGILGLGALLVIGGELTPGMMIAASILMGRALAPMEQAINAWRGTVAAKEAYERIKAVAARAPELGSAMPLPTPTGKLDVEGMIFAYPGAKAPSLSNISFHLGAGTTLAVVGPTASGKTTLARALVGNLKSQRGHVRLDGIDVATWSPADRGPHVGYLPQDVELFGGSVRQNIARLSEGESEAVVAAARLAGVHEMILSLPDGYDTDIGDEGAILSGGQRQRIGLARAVYGSPKLIVLDEPNANLDNEGEEALMRTIAALKEAEATVIVIAHRSSILRRVDRVLVLREGAVSMYGTPDELIPKLTRSASAQASEKSRDAK